MWPVQCRSAVCHAGCCYSGGHQKISLKSRCQTYTQHCSLFSDLWSVIAEMVGYLHLSHVSLALPGLPGLLVPLDHQWGTHLGALA